MNSKQFEECKKINGYDKFFEAALGADGLTLKQYQEFMPIVFEVVPKRKEKEPILMYEKIIEDLEKRWTASKHLPFHGPWHHVMVPGIIIASLRNNGYDFTDADIGEAMKRGAMVPGGSCGFHGICGAGTALGIATSIVTRSTDFHDKERSEALEAASEAISRIAKFGDPRCCRLSTYTTLSLATKRLAKMGYKLPEEKTVGRCEVHQLNNECHGLKCPYFPRPEPHKTAI
jgi:hypothetical protein